MTTPLLTILEFPDVRLRTKAATIQTVTRDIAALADQMLATMYQAPGIGLAATQVNVHLRLIVCDTSEDQQSPHIFINPRLVEGEGRVEYERPRPHNFHRDIGYIDTVMGDCETCSGYGELEVDDE